MVFGLYEVGMNPKLSMLVTTYNHEKYIAQCIQSILTQSFQDFELIIVDDGSTDNTRKIIQQFTDPRIIYHYQENRGPSAAGNVGVALAKTEFISIISGDDVAYEGRLERQYNYFLTYPETTILFGRCEIIDEKSNSLPKHPLQKFFDDVQYTNQYKIFHQFFFSGNCLNAATCMFRRSVFCKIGGFQYASIQLQDYMLWFEWLKYSELVLLDDKLAYYRIRKENQNLSSKKNDGRMFFEFATILENIFDGLDIDFFKKAFEKEIQKKNFLNKIDFELEKAFLYFKHKQKDIQAIGLKKLFYLLQDDKVRSEYLGQYGMSMQAYYALTEKSKYKSSNSKIFFQKLKQNIRFICKKILKLVYF